MPSGGCLEPGKAWLYSFPFLYKKGYYTNTLNPTLALLFRVSLVAQMVKSLLVMWEIRVQSLGQKDPLRRKWQPTPVLLPGKFHEQRGLVGYSPWGRQKSRSRLSD